jgi:prepilin-type N-terminal cleavage/methylation domain-containing protein
MKRGQKKTRQSGFSLIELLVVIAILTIVMAVIFREIGELQKRYRTEESKLDLSQEARQVMDSIVRDLHSAGFPSVAMFTAGVLNTPPNSDARAAAGIVRITPTEIWFEGDINGDGVVRIVRYTMFRDADGNCPCQLRRSEVDKINDLPLNQSGTNYITLLNNVINSGGSGGSGPNNSRSIAGNSIMPNGTAVANDTIYGVYRREPVFAAFAANGAAVTLPQDISTTAGEQAIRSIRTVRITLNVLSPLPDMSTNLRPVMSLASNARIKN